jgi:hypothetical protein
LRRATPQSTRCWVLRNISSQSARIALHSHTTAPSAAAAGFTAGLAKRVIACLDVRSNDAGDLVVTKGDQYDVREKDDAKGVRNLGKPVELCKTYYEAGADEVTFLNITGFRDFPLGDLPMLQVCCTGAGCVLAAQALSSLPMHCTLLRS